MKSKRSSAVLGGIGLAVLVLLVGLWRLSVPAPAAAARADGAAASSDGTRATPIEAAPVPDEAAERASTADASRRDPVAEAPAGQPMCRIRVVDAASRAPVRGAHVWLQRDDVDVASPAWMRTMSRFNDVELTLQDGLGRELEPDERGEVRVPRPAHRLCVAAARGDLHGEGKLEPDDAECIVELKPYHALVVEVVDRAGQPLEGAHVAFYWGEPEPDPVALQLTLRTGADGRVPLPKLESQLFLEGYSGPIHATLAGGAACAPESLTFSLDSLPGEPIRLVALEHASLVVQLMDRQGNELALDGRCGVDLVWEPAAEPSQAQRAGNITDEPFHAGRATFECIGLGLSFEIGVTAYAHTSEWRVVPGPVEAGERLLVQMPVGAPRARIRGHVRGLEACFGDARVSEVGLAGHNGTKTAAFRSTIGDDGSFEDTLWGASTLAALGGPWVLELSRRGRSSAEVSVTPVLDEQSNALDFGEVVFQPSSALALVHVCDESGKPVGNAAVEIQSPLGEQQAWCDAEGRCLVSEPSARLPMRVRASHREWLPSAWQTVESPGSELTLVLQRGARITGQLLLPRGARGDDLEVRLSIEPTTPGAEPQEATTSVLEGGAFVLAPCQPGRATLTVELAGFELVERPGLVIAGDAELEPIDLRALLYAFQLTFELASGEPWSGGHLEVLEPDGAVSTWLEIGASARATFLAPRASVDLWVAGRGALATRFAGVLDGDRLTLPAAPSVRVRLPSTIARPASPLALVVRGRWSSVDEPGFEADDDTDVQDAVVDEDGSAWLRVPWPGPYELAWFVRHTGTGVEVEIEQDELQRLEITATSDVPTVEARLTRDEVEAALREAGG